MYGNFIKDTAGYEINTFNLPTSWEYVYENKDILLKVDQYGPMYAQANPPGDIMLFKREQHSKYSPWFINITDEDGERITNFFKPCHIDDSSCVKDIKIQYLPECATYSFEYKSLRLETEIFIPNKGVAISYKFRIKNIGKEKTVINVAPQLSPHLNDAIMAPWDKYEWYLDTTCSRDDKVTFRSELLDPNASSEKRRFSTLKADAENLKMHELSLEKYIGQGDLLNPERCYTDTERIYSYPPVYALSYEWELAIGEEKELTQVLCLDNTQNDELFFDNASYLTAKKERKAVFDELFSRNSITTGDADFDYYANYWVPLQMNWVASLDRGWPTGMRGSRDSAQDYAALLYTDTAPCKDIILTMLECQRSDGWFPRQYSAKGKYGKHDLREYVDSGAFFVEFVWKYLSHTHNFAILNEEIEWLDSASKDSILSHIIKAVEYYMHEDNIGVHGLCKIREGDWLDSVNTAGIEGKGESVTVSEQVVMCCFYLADILNTVNNDKDTTKYIDFARRMKENINKFAFNSARYYNSVFNDDGKWIFSENDPDGKRRVYGVPNYYAVISGVADKSKFPSILSVMEELKCDMGYRLFYPPLGGTPIDKVGRVASGDTPPFAVENGNVYNHGSQGFLARSLSVMGEGDKLFDVLKWTMPYDTSLHPTEKTFTPPYAIVNAYQQLPGFHHRGLMCFLTGSVAMAMRGIYEWLLGIKPCLDGIEIEPCIPACMQTVSAKINYMGKELNIKLSDNKVYINGAEITEQRNNIITGNKVWFVKTI